jgi:hypothetical protein
MVLKYVRGVQIPVRRHESVWSQATLDHVKVFFEHVRCIDTQRQKDVQVGAFLMCILPETVLAGQIPGALQSIVPAGSRGGNTTAKAP